jgi:hypothetical protein
MTKRVNSPLPVCPNRLQIVLALCKGYAGRGVLPKNIRASSEVLVSFADAIITRLEEIETGLELASPYEDNYEEM